MPLSNFDGTTFVAYIDISGFKELMKDKSRAWKALSKFYQLGFDAILNSGRKVEGLFVSDCGVLVTPNHIEQESSFHALLHAIRSINREMLRSDYMLTTSIAYGDFKYQQKIEFSGIEKNPIYGNAYLQAFSDNTYGSPKLEPGLCRIVREGFPQSLDLTRGDDNLSQFALVRQRQLDQNHLYYYWNLDSPNQISNFENRYRDTYNLRFQGILKALKETNVPA